MFLRSTELSKAFGLRKLCFQNICSDASRVQDFWNLTNTRVRTKTYMPCVQMLHICIYIQLQLVLYMPGAKQSKTVVEFS